MIYSQSFFFSALREDSSKSNSRALRSRAEFHSLQKAILFSVTVGLCVLFAVVGARSKRHPSDGPFHRFLRPAMRNLSPADTYPLYQERTSVRRPGRVFCGSKIWKGR